jgi:hypothetical protein
MKRQTHARAEDQAAADVESELLRLPASASEELLYDRCPSKAWALRRALDDLLDGGTAPKPVSGWSLQRAAAGAQAAAVGA